MAKKTIETLTKAHQVSTITYTITIEGRITYYSIRINIIKAFRNLELQKLATIVTIKN